MPRAMDQPSRCKINKNRSCSFIASPSHQEQEQMLLSTQQRPEDQKKTRNRLAQRKRRERKCEMLKHAKIRRLRFWAIRPKIRFYLRDHRRRRMHAREATVILAPRLPLGDALGGHGSVAKRKGWQGRPEWLQRSF